MRKLKLMALDLGAAELLDKESQKNVFGSSGSGSGGGSGTGSCSCTLIANNGQHLSLPESVTENWTTAEDCRDGCDRYCKGANQGGGSGSGGSGDDGGCKDFHWSFSDAS